MKMTITMVLSCILNFSLNSQAGIKEVGNGGVAIVCRDSTNHKITESFLLDLFEAENMGKPVKRSTLPAEVQIKEKLEKLKASPGIQYEIRRQIQILNRELHFILQPEVGMPLTNDTFPKLKRKGCEYEQVATYFEDEKALPETKGVLHVDKEIYDSFKPTDQAALWFHESLYKLDRRLNGSKDSRKTRDLNGLLFSVNAVEDLLFLLNKTFPLFVNTQEAIWLDPTAELVFQFSSDVPSGSQCYVNTLMGPVFVDTKPYKEEVKIPVGWSEKLPSMNGQRYVPVAECWMLSGQEGKIKFEIFQRGEKIVGIEMSMLKPVSASGSLFRSNFNKVKYPNDHEATSLVWRFR